jgi:NADPH:quinone reductase-like Zn-dependent oxidoreductase
MNAAVVHSFDSLPRYTSFADPVPAEGETLVNVTAAGLHPIVKALASGTHYGSTGELPFIPGIDGVGRRQDGTRVYFGMARSPFGTFCERGLAAQGMSFEVPDELDDVTAAAIANPGMSSWVTLTIRAQLVAGESVLILGATGVAGKFALQIAKRLGARRVIAVGRDAQALEEVRQLGTDAVISLDQDHDVLVSSLRREWDEGGVDVVLDYLWGYAAESVMEAIGRKGLRHAASPVRFVQVGESAGKTISLAAATLRSSGLELLGSGFGSASLRQIFEALAEFFRVAAKVPFQINVKAVSLRDVEMLWNQPERGVRLVFQP